MLQKQPVILSFFPTSNHPFLKSTTFSHQPSRTKSRSATSVNINHNTRDLNRCDPYEHKLTQNRLHIWLCRSSRSKLSAQRMARPQPLAGAPNWRWQYDVIRWCNMIMMRSRVTMLFFLLLLVILMACMLVRMMRRQTRLVEAQVAVWVMSRQKSCGTPHCMIQGKMTLKTTEMETMYDLGLLGRVERKTSIEKTPWCMSLAFPERECWHHGFCRQKMIETIQKEQIQAFSTKASGANACSTFEIGTQCCCRFFYVLKHLQWKVDLLISRLLAFKF